MPDRPSVNRLSRPSAQASRFWGEITVPGIEEDRFDGQSGPSRNVEPGVSQRLTDHRGRLRPGDIETWATQTATTAPIYGRAQRRALKRPGRPPKEHARSETRYMLPVGTTPPPDATTVESQILHALQALEQATERQVLELIARDRWPLAHKAFTQMVASQALVSASRTNRHLNQRRRIESQAVVVLRGVVLKRQVSSSVSASAYIQPEGRPKPVHVVAFGPLGHALWRAEEGSFIEVRGRWLSSGRRPYFRISDFAVRAASGAVEDWSPG